MYKDPIVSHFNEIERICCLKDNTIITNTQQSFRAHGFLSLKEIILKLAKLVRNYYFLLSL